jgi:hypothetical protein
VREEEMEEVVVKKEVEEEMKEVFGGGEMGGGRVREIMVPITLRLRPRQSTHSSTGRTEGRHARVLRAA